VVEAVMEQGGTGWRAVLGERTGINRRRQPAKPRLSPSNAES